MKQESIPNSRIDDPQVAEDMAYAAAPYMDRLLEVKASGENSEAWRRLNEAADEFSQEAGDTVEAEKRFWQERADAAADRAGDIDRQELLAAKVDSLYESMPDIEEFVTAQYLSFNDVDLPSERRTIIDDSRWDADGKYVRSLIGLMVQFGTDEVLSRAQKIRDKTLHDLEDLGIPASDVAGSISWSLSDIAQQEYLYQNPDEIGEAEDLGDPLFSTQKLQEVEHRQIGWEAYEALKRNDPEFLATMSEPENRDIIERIRNTELQPTGVLSLEEAERLGRDLLSELRLRKEPSRESVPA